MTASGLASTIQTRTFSRPQEQIEAMLYRLRDAMEGASSVLPTGAGDSRLLMFPRSYNAAFRELDRCLGELRQSEPRLHWHVRAWYVDCDWKQEESWRWVVLAGKRRKVPAGWRMIALRHRDADQPVARAGVAALALLFRFDRIHLKDLTEAMGEGLYSR